MSAQPRAEATSSATNCAMMLRLPFPGLPVWPCTGTSKSYSGFSPCVSQRPSSGGVTAYTTPVHRQPFRFHACTSMHALRALVTQHCAGEGGTYHAYVGSPTAPKAHALSVTVPSCWAGVNRPLKRQEGQGARPKFLGRSRKIARKDFSISVVTPARLGSGSLSLRSRKYLTSHRPTLHSAPWLSLFGSRSCAWRRRSPHRLHPSRPRERRSRSHRASRCPPCPSGRVVGLTPK